jgi:hypothetical protein
VIRLVENGVIAEAKFIANHVPQKRPAPAITNTMLSQPEDPAAHHHGVLAEPPAELSPQHRMLLQWPAYAPMHVSRDNAAILLNLLWPLGIANYLESNVQSPVNTNMLSRFASTSGWKLGREENGAAYFNKVHALSLTPDQEALAVGVADNCYRPCCNNSTFFQDCNHGSALFGLLQLGAAQGLTESDLYEEALVFNAFWFPDHYVQTMLYLTFVQGKAWEEIDPAVVMGFDYSAIGPWRDVVKARLDNYPNLVPKPASSVNCAA